MEQVLTGKVAIITGASQGLGLAIARRYIAAGASVMLCARDSSMLAKASGELAQALPAGQRLRTSVADVAVGQDAERLVSETQAALGGCHILVNNAGIYGPIGEVETLDWQDWLKAIEINLFGSVLMCRAILPCFKAQGYGKIIQLSGGGATAPLPRLSAYAVSKAAIVRFAETLAEEVRGQGIDVNAIAPGALNTRMLAQVLDAGPERAGADFFERAQQQKRSGGTPLDLATELAVFLACSESDGITGRLISAVWDNWRVFADHLGELMDSDVCTLRRIAGRDRGFAWADK